MLRYPSSSGKEKLIDVFINIRILKFIMIFNTPSACGGVIDSDLIIWHEVKTPVLGKKMVQGAFLDPN
jgi:hypothetical protein